jgi:HAD superfamily hydrolase (TIGR01662 family)
VEEDDRSAFMHLFSYMREKGFALPDFESAFAVYRELFYGMIHVSHESHQEACFELVLKYLLYKYRIDIQGKLEDLLMVYYKALYACRKVYPDTVPALEKLKAGAVRMGIVSNTTNPRFMKDHERVSSGLDPYFEFAVYSSELPYRKPHSSIFKLAADRLGLDAREILFVGDDLRADIEGAQGVGMHTAWLNRDNKAKIGDIRPEYEIDTLADLPNINAPTA